MLKKKNILILISIILILVIAIILCMLTNKVYKDNYSSKELYNLVSESFATDGGVRILESDVILEFSEEDISYLEDFIVVKANNAKNINEIGIFRVEAGTAKELKPLIDKYVSNLQKSYRAMDYFPEEVEKIDFSKVTVFGDYVIYSFLNEKDTVSFYRNIEKNIRK